MPGVLQVTLYTNPRRKSKQPQEDLTQSWSLPAVIFPETTKNEFQHPIVLQERIARGLGLMEGDFVTLALNDYSSSQRQKEDVLEPGVQAWSSSTNSYPQQHQTPLFRLKISIDPSASFDVAIEANSPRTRRIFGGTVHNPMGNFLIFGGPSTGRKTLKLTEQQRLFRANKSSKDLKCSGMMMQIEGLADSLDGAAGCGYCIYASSPLTHPRPSDLMVQGYRYLGTNAAIHDNPQEAVYFGLLEALQWVFRLDFQMVWIVGSMPDVFRCILNNTNAADPQPKAPPSCSSSDSATEETSMSTTAAATFTVTPMMKFLHKQITELLGRARNRRIQFKFLSSEDTEGALDMATQAIVTQRNETWCYWDNINYQAQRQLPFAKSVARQVSI